jgi:hypothetical protein
VGREEDCQCGQQRDRNSAVSREQNLSWVGSRQEAINYLQQL